MNPSVELMSGLHMNGIIYHGFAATMTLAVISFPTPSDLIERLRSPFLPDQIEAEAKFLPTLTVLAAERESGLRLDEIRPLVTACLDSSLQGSSAETTGACGALALIGSSALSGEDVPTVAIREPATIEAAAAYFCRARWAEKRSMGEAFATEICLTTEAVAN